MEHENKSQYVIEAEIESYIFGGKMAAEYAKSIGKHDLATFTGDEWLTFCECMCKNYHEKFNELDEIPF